MRKIVLRRISEGDIEYIKRAVRRHALDGRNLDQRQFTGAYNGDRMIGFCRVLDHGEHYELATLYVEDSYRGSGLAKRIVRHLIDSHRGKPYFITTHIPDFFMPFGFEYVDEYPQYIKEKIEKVCLRGGKNVRVMALRR